MSNEVYNKRTPRSYCSERESESNSNSHDENAAASPETSTLSDDDRLIYKLHLDACKVRANSNAYKLHVQQLVSHLKRLV